MSGGGVRTITVTIPDEVGSRLDDLVELRRAMGLDADEAALVADLLVRYLGRYRGDFESEAGLRPPVARR